jgi:hypothetical protein
MTEEATMVQGGSTIHGDWRSLVMELFRVGLDAFAQWAEEQQRSAHASQDVEDGEVIEARAILNVAVDASPDEIRAALRSKLRDSRLHPDQGGDGEEAKRLIAAQNLLLERAREAGQ